MTTDPSLAALATAAIDEIGARAAVFGRWEEIVVLALALVWDRLLGEPRAALHPVVWMGRLITAAERRARRGSARLEFVQGVAIALGVPLVFVVLALWGFARLESRPWLHALVAVFVCKSMFAVRMLGEAGEVVRRALAAGDLAGARVGLGSLCSRDPSNLDERAVAAGAVESIAENTSDSVVAPLFFYALFGLPGAIAYRAVNTLDAMIGYHGRYEYLGKAAARIDDVLNFVPARLTAALLLIAGTCLGHDGRAGLRVLARDGGKTESPNAGRPMAAMAGLLGVRLAKEGHYQLGDDLRAIEPADLAKAWRICALAAYTCFAAAAVAIALRVAFSAGGARS